MTVSFDIDDIKMFLAVNGYDWDKEVIDEQTGEIRAAKIEDITESVHRPTLKFNDCVKWVAINGPYFTLDLLATDGKFELYDYKPGKHGERDEQILFDDLSMVWETYLSQVRCK